MTIKQDFLKLAGLPDNTPLTEAVENQTVEFAKNSIEVGKVRGAVRKAIHYCEDAANKTRNINFRKAYEKDSEDYDNILMLVASNRRKAAQKAWAYLDTSARDILFDVITDPEVKQLVANYMGTTLNVRRVEEATDQPLKKGDKAKENRLGSKPFEIIKIVGNIVTGSDGKTYHITKIVPADKQLSEEVDENDKIVDKDVQELKKLVAKLEKAQEKDVADEGTEDTADKKVTISIAKIKADIETLIKAQQHDDANEVAEAVNHMGEREYQTWSGWKSACKKAYPGCAFRGDKDIGAATLDGKDVGEWDGAVGSVYEKQVAENKSADQVSDDTEDYSSMSDKQLIKTAHQCGIEKVLSVDEDGDLAKRTEVVAALKDCEGKSKEKTTESADIKVADLADTVKDESKTEDRADTTKVPAEVTKSLTDKMKDLETEIKYISHLDSQSDTIINLNGAIQVMSNIKELMAKGDDESMKKISILLMSLEGPQKVLIPKEVWKYMAVDYANPVAKSSLMDRFREVKAYSSKLKD